MNTVLANSMKFEFNGGILKGTDYYSSTDFTRRLAWLVVRERVWHLLLPGSPRSYHCVQAGPVEDQEEPDGWMWCVDVDGQKYPLPRCRIEGPRPALPDRGAYLKRTAILYVAEARNANGAAFGGVHDLHSGLVCTAHPLWLTYGLRVGYAGSGKSEFVG